MFGKRYWCCCASFFNLVRLDSSGSPPGAEFKVNVGSAQDAIVAIAVEGTTCYAVADGVVYLVDNTGSITESHTLTNTDVVKAGVSVDFSGDIWFFVLRSNDNIDIYDPDWDLDSTTDTLLSGAEDMRIRKGIEADQQPVAYFGGVSTTVASDEFNHGRVNHLGSRNLPTSPALNGATVRGVWPAPTDGSDMTYVAGDKDSSHDVLEKLNAAHASQWTYPADSTYGTAGAIDGDASENIFILTSISGTKKMEKINSSGTNQYSNTPSDTTYNTGIVRVDGSEQWYVENSTSIKMYNSSGTKQWTDSDVPGSISDIELDTSGQLWVAGAATAL